jgi:hypothetical protein
MSTRGELIRFPNGEAVYYVDEDHSYWRCKDNEERGRRLTGVTTATKTLDVRVDPLLGWAARTQTLGFALLAQEEVEQGAELPPWMLEAEQIWRRLEAAELDFENVRDKAGVKGSTIHEEVFVVLASGAQFLKRDQLSEEEQGYADACVQFWLDHSPEAVQVEQIVADPELGIAGRLDFRGLLREECDDELCPCHGYYGPGVIDAKTGSFLAASAHAQVAGYRHCAAACGFGESGWGALLQLGERGSYRLVDSTASPQDFVQALETYRAAGRIDREAGKNREKRRRR